MMTETQTKQAIEQALHNLASGTLATRARALLGTLGYMSERFIELAPNTAATFIATFDLGQRLDPDKALLNDWRSVDLLFQLTDDNIGDQARFAFDSSNQVDNALIQSYLFFAIDLRGATYTRTQLATITREVNKLFPMPAMLIFRHGPTLTFLMIDRRLHKRDEAKDVLEKVTLIRDILLAQPHRAHIEILFDLSLPQLRAAYNPTNFVELHRAWQRTLDSSELNKRFFREIANWYFWAIQKVTFPPDAETKADVRNATSVIRLLTRLIFVWFLKEKGLVKDDLFDQQRLRNILVSMEPDETTYYTAILQNLFFATLNTEMNNSSLPRRFRSRNTSGGRDGHRMVHNVYRYEQLFRAPDAALELFQDIPFLNGGLFECLDRENDDGSVVRIDGFSDHPKNPLEVPNRLFFSGTEQVDLNTVYGTRGKRYETRGLIEILHSYKFTVAENTPVEEEIALDPELLGQVFENLLAAYNPETETTARKETGSFYTPRGIVEYMVDESLLLHFKDHLASPADTATTDDDQEQIALEDRLRGLLAYTDVPHSFTTPDELNSLIAAIDQLKIIDPACGSGAFPMGILHKLAFVLSKLDPHNERWREQQRQRAVRETEAAFHIDGKDEREARLIDINDAFEHNSSDYGRKLYLIENSIYGVDIQPIAVQIAKLRCFIALIVDQRIENQRENRGIRPLPNLETRFVAADALNGVQWQGLLRSDEVIAKEKELADVRSHHFSARTPKRKRELRKRDQTLRAELAALLRLEGIPGTTADLLARWNPYDQNDYARFFDPEWMFGVTDGFDVVIANPPYVRQEQIKEKKRDLERQFSAYTGTADLFVYFYERAVQLLDDGGVLTFISSNKYFRAGYGKKLRALLATRLRIHQLIDFGDAPVFKAIAYPSIIIAQKQSPDAQQVRVLNWNPTNQVADFPQIFHDTNLLIQQKTLTADGWRLEGPAVQRLLEKLRRGGRPLGEYVNGRFYRGILTGLNEAFVVDRATRDRLIVEHPSSADLLKPFLRGRDVKRWRVEPKDLWLIFTRRGTDIAKYPALYQHLLQFKSQLTPGIPGGRKPGNYEWFEIQDNIAYWQEFEQPKIVYPDIYEHQSFTYEESSFYTANTCYFIPTSQIWLTGLLNSQSVEWFYSLVSNKVRGGYLRAFSDYMRQIPIPAGSNAIALEHLVKQIQADKTASPEADVGALEREIDERVYALYGLRPDEIRMIEEVVGKEQVEV